MGMEGRKARCEQTCLSVHDRIASKFNYLQIRGGSKTKVYLNGDLYSIRISFVFINVIILGIKQQITLRFADFAVCQPLLRNGPIPVTSRSGRIDLAPPSTVIHRKNSGCTAQPLHLQTHNAGIHDMRSLRCQWRGVVLV